MMPSSRWLQLSYVCGSYDKVFLLVLLASVMMRLLCRGSWVCPHLASSDQETLLFNTVRLLSCCGIFRGNYCLKFRTVGFPCTFPENTEPAATGQGVVSADFSTPTGERPSRARRGSPR